MESSMASGVFRHHHVPVNIELASEVFLGLAFKLASFNYLHSK